MNAATHPLPNARRLPLNAQGFEVHRQLIPHTLIERARAQINHGLEEVASCTHSTPAMIERVVSAWSRRSEFVKAAVDIIRPALCEAIESHHALPDDLHAPIDASLFIASGQSPTATHGHQDIAYRWNRPSCARYAYTTWVALDACDAATGALRFTSAFPATPVALRQDFLNPSFVDLALTPRWRAQESVAAVEPGDVVVFDACTWHASAPYEKSGHRMALAIRWTSRSQWERSLPLPPVTPDPNVFGMETSGKLLSDAICDACRVSRPVTPHDGTTHTTVRELLASHADVCGALSPTAQSALHDLSFALKLHHNHGARVAAHVWEAVRDHTLLELRALGAGRVR